MTTLLAGDVGCKRLHDAVTDDPGGKKAADHPEVPVKYGAQVDRQRYDKPDVASAKEKQSCGREDVDRPALGQHVAELRFGFGLAQVLFQQQQAAYPDQCQRRRHGQHRHGEAEQREQCTAEEESHAFERVFRACEDRHPFVEGALLAIRY
ncbi:hypothetical protein D3C77_396210 [compost metagenome]